MTTPRSYLTLLANRNQLNGLSFADFRDTVGVQDWMDVDEETTLTDRIRLDRLLYRAWKSVLTF